MNTHISLPPERPKRWDIFCQVIDNFGDAGVCWRLAADLGARGHHVRLYMDDASALQWMAPQGAERVSVLPWPVQAQPGEPGDVIIEAFGCEIPEAFVSAIACKHQRDPSSIVWINLEYLSAESYVERCHRLPSPIMSGPAAGMTRWFFYPGFTERTGGLLREPDLPERQRRFDRAQWRLRHGVAESDTAISLFCYEPAALPHVLKASLGQAADCRWLVTPGRAERAVRQALQSWPPAQRDGSERRIGFLPYRTQREFDELLWACDLNFVRGEDSLVRALWAGQPFIWQIYPQHDDAHHDKLHAFLDWLQAPASLRHMHAVWNGLQEPQNRPFPDKDMLDEWRACARFARDRLLRQEDLLSQFLGFVAEKS
ncbi:elongation factor P maturation arginine rhamnosyltransferase EarP [Diaphorobacter ruginosibacter]|uniref:elongation factor P maturation arginine rhamnosyltransferase EarP n=1 Tax=Diaphorobacter ruginosibacter TaxID=1715720 RepID=UPI0033412607